jgi:hypothetical protein
VTWLLVPLVWTLGAVVVAPFVGRVLRHADVSRRGLGRPSLPTPRRPLVLR